MANFKDYINSDLVEAELNDKFKGDSVRDIQEEIMDILKNSFGNGRGNVIYDENRAIHIEVGTHFASFLLHDTGKSKNKVTLNINFSDIKEKSNISKLLKSNFFVNKVSFEDESREGENTLYSLSITFPYLIAMSKEEVNTKLEKLASGTSLMQIIFNSDRTDLVSYFLSDDFCKEEYKKFRDAAKKIGITDADVKAAFGN